MNENSPTKENNKLSTIFLVVLGVHVLALAVVGIYQLLKGSDDTQKQAKLEKPEQVNEEIVEAQSFVNELQAERTEMPKAQSPILVTQENTPGNQTSPFASEVKSSMPPLNSPVYGAKGEMTPPKAFNNRSYEKVKTVGVKQVPTQRVTSFSEPVKKPKAVVSYSEVKKSKVSANWEQVSSYSVQKGDTLSRIAKRHGVKVSELKRANKLNSDLIRIGQKLNVPQTKKAVAQIPVKTKLAEKMKVSPTSGNRYGSYQVLSGDTLWRIAQQYGTTPKEIAQLNGISDPKKLKVGMKLKVPSESNVEVKEVVVDPVRPKYRESFQSEMAMLREATR